MLEMQKVKFWPKNERPRERLLAQGAEALSDAELLAIVLRNGRKGQDVMSLSRQLVESFGGMQGLASANGSQLQKIKGLGPAKISSLLAIREIARRQLKESIQNRDIIKDPESVVLYLKHCLSNCRTEVFKVLFLNKANRILREQDLFHGTVDEAAVHPQEVARKALEYHASSVLLVHNHPSGRCEPSSEDLHITRKIQAACDTVAVKVIDHIIIGGENYFSFREHGRMI